MMSFTDAAMPGTDERGGYAAVSLSALPVGHAWRVGGLDDAHVAALAARYSHLPPVLVRRHDHLVIDGAHTVAAARRLGMQVAHVQWFDGSWTDAAEEFVARNSKPGSLEIAADDRRALIADALRAEPTWSDRRIAQLCGASPKMIARVRVALGAPEPVQRAEKRVGRDGRARPVRSGAMRPLIEQMLAQHPDASLRTIASALGVSPETVRSVRRDGAARPADGRGEPRAADAGLDELAVLRLCRDNSVASAPAPWRSDSALSSTSTGEEFVKWFETTNVNGGADRAHEVPLSRIYEIADEARRRAAYWQQFADTLERRARGRR